MSIAEIIKQTVSLLERHHRRRGLWIIGLMIVNALLDFFSLAAFLPLLIVVIDPTAALQHPVIASLYAWAAFDSHGLFLIAACICLVLFITVKNVIGHFIAEAKAQYAFGIRTDLSTAAMQNFIQKDFAEFTDTDFSKEQHLITSHPLAFAKNVIMAIASIISDTLVGLLVVGLMIFFDFKALVLVTLVIPPSLMVFRLRRKTLREISKNLKFYPLMLKYSNQIIEGFVDMIVYRKTLYFYRRFNSINKKLSETFIKDQTVQSGTLRLTETVVTIVMCALIIYSVIVRMSIQQTLVLLGLYAGASFRIVPTINRILHSFQQIRTNEYVLKELNNSPPVYKKTSDTPSEKPNFHKIIELRNIYFQYPLGPIVLHDVSMRIHKGEKIAITGASGEGKTTLLLILLGFLNPDSGAMLVDGNPVNNGLRQLCGYVPQNPYIMDGSIAENIAFGVDEEKIERSRIKKILNDLNLTAMISQMPEGIDTRIGERGVKISGGQRQRIALARALYFDAEILILDEVTSQINQTLETEIMNVLDRIADNKTTIILVTHKKPTVPFDAIYHLHKGKISDAVLI